MSRTAIITTLEIDLAEIAALAGAVELAASSDRPETGALMALLRKLDADNTTLLRIEHRQRRRAAKTTAELLAEHAGDLDAKIARRRSSPEIVAGGSL